MTTTFSATKLPRVESPPLLQLFRTVFSPQKSLIVRRDQLGDNFYVAAPNYPNTLVVGSPQGIEEVFNLSSDKFTCASANDLVSPIFGNHSLLMTDGAAHSRRRKILMPPFHGKSIQAFGETMVSTTQTIAQTWTKKDPFSIHTSMQEITLSVILKAIFGLSKGDRYQELQELLANLLNAFNSPLLSLTLFMPILQKDLGHWSPWGKFVRTKARIYDLLHDEIQDRRAKQDFGNDVLSLLLASEDEDGQALSNEVLQDELMTMLFAGHETTASTTTWAFYWIHQHPEVKEKLLAELNDLPNNASLMEIAKLPYLDAVCNETLRIQPVVLFTFGRVLSQDTDLLGATIPKNTMLAPCIYLAHYNPEVFPNPEQFNPERFLNRTYSPYEFIPFGGGNRRCLGYAFAQFEMKVILATILKEYPLELVSKQPVKPARRGITMMPSTGVPMRLAA